MVGLDPSNAASGSRIFAEALESNWRLTRTETGDFKERPLWTYFELAKARQWLWLNKPERASSTLDYFWAQSPALGLFTQWESDKEENSSHRWNRVRGWLTPRHVTPHYWSAAEMILTQVAMLAYVDRDTLVIGAGVSEAWLAAPLKVDGLITGVGPVSWRWDGRELRVSLCDPAIKVRGAHALERAAVVIDRC
jgi:hypothetical protein